MASVIKKIFIDVNNSVEIQVKIDGKNLDFDIIYDKEKENDIGFRNYVNNLKKLIKVEYHYDKNNKVDSIGIFLGRFKLGQIDDYQLFGAIDKNAKYHSIYKLNTSEERLLSQGSLRGIEELGAPFQRYESETPLTDLHTHLTGALTSDDAIFIARKFNPHIEISILAKAGIDVSKYSSVYDYAEGKTGTGEIIKVARIQFNFLSDKDVELYKKKLSIGVNAQETFGAMENCYSFRHPILRLGGNAYDKDVNIEMLFLEQLRCLAKHYRKTGVKYAELSMSEICKAPDEFLMVIDKVMPTIESEFPDVRLRFLGGIPRILNKPALKLRNENLLAAARSPYIAGIDVMAHEVNETNHFGEIIADCLEYANKNNDPNFVIRVHAGESDVHYDNIKQFLLIVNEYTEKTGNKPPVIRIGHGINGFDDETIKLAVKLGAIVEINLSSNLALNNIDNIKQVFLKKYKDAGLKVVISTDGHGMYSTDSKQETELALAAGFTPEDIHDMVEFEQTYIENAQKSYEEKKHNHDIEKVEYLAELSQNLIEKLKFEGKSFEDLKKLPPEVAAEKLASICLSVDLGKVSMIGEDEFKTLIEKGFLDVDFEETLSIDDIRGLLQAIPQEFYVIRHSVDNSISKELNDKSIEESIVRADTIRARSNGLKKYMSVKTPPVQVYDQKQPIPVKSGKQPICIIGYVDNQWDKLSDAAKKEIIAETIELVSSLDPKKNFLIATAEKEGFNEVLIDIVKKVNPKLEIIGLAHEKQILDLKQGASKQLKWLRDNFDGIKIEKGNQFDYSTNLADYLKENGGTLVAFGDGSHMKDHIINLHNRNGKIHLYNGKFSGSSKVDFLRGNGYEFADSTELVERVGGKLILLPSQIERLTREMFEIQKQFGKG